MSYVSDINELIWEILHIDAEEIDEDTDLRADLQAEEEQIREIAQLIDDDYDTDLSDHVEDIMTIGDMYEFLSR